MRSEEAREAISTSRSGAIELAITAQEYVVEGTAVRRLIPAPGCPMVGPFISFDHIDSVQSLLPGGASLGIESTTEVAILSYCSKQAFSQAASRQAGLPTFRSARCWIALPDEADVSGAESEQYVSRSIPEIRIEDISVRVILGEAYGKSSPVSLHLPILMLECTLPERAEFQLPTSFTELAVYVVDGFVTIDGHDYTRGMMAITAAGWPVRLSAQCSSGTVMIIGGEPPRLVRKTHKWTWS